MCYDKSNGHFKEPVDVSTASFQQKQQKVYKPRAQVSVACSFWPALLPHFCFRCSFHRWSVSEPVGQSFTDHWAKQKCRVRRLYAYLQLALFAVMRGLLHSTCSAVSVYEYVIPCSLTCRHGSRLTICYTIDAAILLHDLIVIVTWCAKESQLSPLCEHDHVKNSLEWLRHVLSRM